MSAITNFRLMCDAESYKGVISDARFLVRKVDSYLKECEHMFDVIRDEFDGSYESARDCADEANRVENLIRDGIRPLLEEQVTGKVDELDDLASDLDSAALDVMDEIDEMDEMAD